MSMLFLLKLMRELETNMCRGWQKDTSRAEHVNNKAYSRPGLSSEDNQSHLLARAVCRPTPGARPRPAPSNPL